MKTKRYARCALVSAVACVALLAFPLTTAPYFPKEVNYGISVE